MKLNNDQENSPGMYYVTITLYFEEAPPSHLGPDGVEVYVSRKTRNEGNRKFPVGCVVSLCPR